MTTLAQEFARSIRPPERISVPDWARKHIQLGPRQATAMKGPYRIDVTPHLRGIFDALADPSINTVCVEKGAQAGATLLAYVWALYTIAEDPGPMLVVMPSVDLARSASETRFMPMIEDSARVSRELMADPDKFKKLEYQFRRSTLNWVGSNSPGNLASRPVRYLILDEVDKYPDDNGVEGNAIALAMQRTKTFWNRKVLILSTPTVEDGNIHRAFLRGDQRRYFLPCHACGHEQWLKWASVKFDSTKPIEEAAAGARYCCEACGAEWTDIHKRDALKLGKWKATAIAREKGYASFHVSSLYAPWTTWEKLVSQFLNAKDHPDMLHDFVNSELGEPWIPDAVNCKEDVIVERMKPYTRGELLHTANCFGDQYRNAKGMIALSVDVQKDRLVWLARQFMTGGDSGLLDYGECVAWEQLAAKADEFGAHGLPFWAMVDSGYGERTQEVYEACLRHRMIPTKGSSTSMRGMTWSQQTINVFEGRKAPPGTDGNLALVHFDTSALKFQLLDRIQGKGPFLWHVFSGVDSEYARQVTSEEYRSDKGLWALKRGHRDNHYWDCEVLALLSATIAGFNSRVFAK